MRRRWFRRSHRAGLPSYPIIKTLRPRGHTHSRARMRAVLLQKKALVFPPLSALCSKGASADAGMGLGLEARDSGHGTRDSGLGTRDSGLGTREAGRRATCTLAHFLIGTIPHHPAHYPIITSPQYPIKKCTQAVGPRICSRDAHCPPRTWPSLRKMNKAGTQMLGWVLDSGHGTRDSGLETRDSGGRAQGYLHIGGSAQLSVSAFVILSPK